MHKICYFNFSVGKNPCQGMFAWFSYDLPLPTWTGVTLQVNYVPLVVVPVIYKCYFSYAFITSYNLHNFEVFAYSVQVFDDIGQYTILYILTNLPSWVPLFHYEFPNPIVGVLNKHQLVNLYLLRVRPGWCAKGHKVYTGSGRMSLCPVYCCSCY